MRSVAVIIAFLSLTCELVLGEYSLPTSLSIDWSGAGVDGGIPERPAPGGSTISVNSYGAVPDDASSDSAAISSALSAASSGDVIEFGAGEYTLTSTFSIPDGVTVRGQGMDITTLKYTGTASSIISAGPTDSCAWNDKWCQQVALASDASKGDTTLTLDTGDGDYTSFSEGDVIVVGMDNSGLAWVDMGDCSWNAINNDAGGSASYHQMVEVVSRDGGTLTVSPGLYTDMPTAQNAFVGRSNISGSFHENIGVEDLTLTRTQNPGSQASMIAFTHCKNSWVKGVEIDTGHGRMIRFLRSYQCTMFQNYVHHGFVYTSGAYNYHFVVERSGRCLVESNVSCYTNKSVQLETTAGGNVIAYNYLDGAWVDETNKYWQGQDIGSHCAHSHHDLIEGNIFNKFNSDAIHGSSSHMVLFRNGIDSDHEFFCQPTHAYDDTQSVAAVQYDLGYYISAIGNVLGKDGRSNIYSCGPGGSCVTSSGSNYIYLSRGSDSLMGTTLLRHHNYDYYNDAIVNNGTDDTDMPDSLYLSAKPSWFGSLTWPNVDADTPAVNDNPAKVFYDTGSWPEESEIPEPPTAKVSGTLSIISQ